MSKSIRLLAASLLTALAATSAQADLVYSTQGVNFTYHDVDADTFTLRIQNALDADGSWAAATHLGYLAFKNLGDLSALTGANVSVMPTPASSIQWTYTKGELSGNGCNTNANSNSICLAATPGLPLSNDLLFTVDLLGAGIDISQTTSVQLKAGFTVWEEATRNKPAGFSDVGDQTALTLQAAAPTNNLPEPASLALAGLALFGAAAARRRNRG